MRPGPVSRPSTWPSRHVHTPATRADLPGRQALAPSRHRRRLVLALVGALTLSAKAIGPSAPEPASPAGPARRRSPRRRGTPPPGRRPRPAGEGDRAQAQHRPQLRALGRWPRRGPGRGLGRRPHPDDLVRPGRHPARSPPAATTATSPRWPAAVAALGRPVLLRYGWGMDGAGPTATRSGAAYVAAWRHVHDLFAAQGVRGFWVWSPNADAFAGARGGVDQYWPGDDYVDWIGGRRLQLERLQRPVGLAGLRPDLQGLLLLGVGQGQAADDLGHRHRRGPRRPGPQARLVPGRGRPAGRSMPRVRAVVLLDQGGRCDWRPDTSAQSMEGFVGFARDPFFGGTTPAPAAPPPTTRPPTTTVPATTTT